MKRITFTVQVLMEDYDATQDVDGLRECLRRIVGSYAADSVVSHDAVDIDVEIVDAPITGAR